MQLDGREKACTIAGGLGLIIGIVALVLAISAHNSSVSDADVEAQVKEQLNASIEDVKGSISSDQGSNRRAQRREEGGINSNANSIVGLKKQNEKLKKQLADTNDEVDKLTSEVKKLTDQVSTLSDDQDKTDAKLRQLTDRVEDLSVKKRNR